MSFRGAPVVIDLTKDDWYGSHSRKPRSRPTADSLIIDILSDSEDNQDESSRPGRTEHTKQVKPRDRQRQQPENSSLRKETKLPFPQHGRTSGKSNHDKADTPGFIITGNDIDNGPASLALASHSKGIVKSQVRNFVADRDERTGRSSGGLVESKVQPEMLAELIGQQRNTKNADDQNNAAQIPTKPYRLHCTECTEIGLECDGERPCSRCVEPGLDCWYPGDPSPRSESLETLDIERIRMSAMRSKPRQQNSIGLTSTSRSTSRDMISQDSDVPLIQRSKGIQAQNPIKTPPDYQINADGQEQFLPCDWTPIEPADIKDLIETVNHNLNTQREYWLQNALLQSVNRIRQIPPNPSIAIKENPFKKLVSGVKEASKSQGEKRTLLIYKGSTLTNKKTMSFSATDLGWDNKQPVLPQYKSIGRMGSNFVARNIHTLKHLPYFPDDEAEEVRTERENWLRRRYRNNGHDNLDAVVKELIDQRACLERVQRWSISFFKILDMLKLTPDIVISYFEQRTFWKCTGCRLKLVPPRAPAPRTSLSSEDRTRCDVLLTAFESLCKFSILHFFEDTGKYPPQTLSILDQRIADSKPSICMVCCVPNCAVHGLYVDGGREENKQGPLINDPEIENNRREQLVPNNQIPVSDHICGLYCTEGDLGRFRYSELFGIDDTGRPTGLRNTNIEPVENHIGFEGFKPCNHDCFIVRSRREGFANCQDNEAREYLERQLSSQQIRFLEAHTRLFKSSVRLPCSLAKRLKMNCFRAFKCLVMLHRSTISSSKHDKPVAVNQGSKKAYHVKPDKYENRELKKPFLPCSHQGPCKKEIGCPCAEREAHCEHSCGCDDACYRRFPGCTCEGSCFDNQKCLCWKYGRECDPWVCKSCGVIEVLDPSNKYSEEIRHGRCKNNRTQLGLPARTVKGSSQIQGWGLFAGEDMPKSTYVGEYKGEVVTRGDTHEAERRGLVYRQGGQEYLFDLNIEQELDGSRFGNKTRYINHTDEEEVINLRSVRQNVNGIARVSFWTKRDIKAGEEFFYNYGYEEEVTQNFRTFNQDLDVDPLLPIPKPVITMKATRRANQTAFDSDEEDSEDDDEEDIAKQPPPPPPEKQTRKRRKVESEDEPLHGFAAVQQRAEPRRTVAARAVSKSVSRQASERQGISPGHRASTKIVAQGMAVDSDSNDKDYVDDCVEANLLSAQSASEAESVDSDNKVLASRDDEPRKGKGRPRLIDKVDKRRGGAAQRKAQETRRKNREKTRSA